MIIYNVTINIENSLQQDWLNWMKTDHIPKVLATGKFKDAKLTRVLIEEEMGGVTYSVQFCAHSRQTLDSYYDDDDEGFRLDGLKKFGDKMLSFCTELEVIEEFTMSTK